MMRFCGLVCEQWSYRRAMEITTETSFQKIGTIWGSNCRNDFFIFAQSCRLAGRAFQNKLPWKAGLCKPDSLLIVGKTKAWELEPLVLRPLLARAWKISRRWLYILFIFVQSMGNAACLLTRGLPTGSYREWMGRETWQTSAKSRGGGRPLTRAYESLQEKTALRVKIFLVENVDCQKWLPRREDKHGIFLCSSFLGGHFETLDFLQKIHLRGR